jgi:hypothetical protein
MDNNLDRSNLTVDNGNTIRDLKSTHFSLGLYDTCNSLSQYKSSYGTSIKNIAERSLPIRPGRCAVNFEEENTSRDLPKTSYQNDFVRLKSDVQHEKVRRCPLSLIIMYLKRNPIHIPHFRLDIATILICIGLSPVHISLICPWIVDVVSQSQANLNTSQ